MKKHLLKDLSVSDIVVVLINQEQSEDRTPQLKHYLYKTVQQTHQEEDTVGKQLILLPQFATTEMTQEQLFLYHLDRSSWSGDQWSNFQSLLQSVNERRKSIIDNSSSIFQKSDKIMRELIEKLGSSYQYLHKNREPLHSLSEHLRSKYVGILKKILKIKNMQKACDVMKLWNKSNISKVLTIRAEDILKYPSIEEVFISFRQIRQFLGEHKSHLLSYTNLIFLLQDRKEGIIKQIRDNMAKSIKQFREQAEYAIKFDQYSFAFTSNLITKQQRKQIGNDSILREENLTQVIDKDIHQIYFQVLSNKFKNSNLQMLNQDHFVNFFDYLMSQFMEYFRKWHKITTFHLQRQTPFKEGFIKHRTTVFQKALERIANSLKFSNKFTYISLPKQLELFEKIQDFIQSGQQWMGKCKNALSSVVLQKYRMQTDTFFKINNGDLKAALFEQFMINSSQQNTKEDDKHMKENQRLKFKLRLADQMQVQVKQFSSLNLDQTKIQKLLHQKQGQSAPKECFLSEQLLQQQMKVYYEPIHTKLGLALFKHIVQYQLRQSYLPDETQLHFIYQHLEFILFIIYKVSIPNYMKREIQKEIFNNLQRDQRISAVKNALNKNPIEESTFTTLNQLRHIFMERNSFGDLYEFLCRIGTKYEGITIATYINTTLYFQEYQKYEGEVKALHEKLLTVMNELYLIVEYLEKVIEAKRFYKAQAISQTVMQLKQVIPAVVLVYFTAFFENSSQKYYKHVLPIFMGLKFEVKKLAADTLVPFKEYRNKIQQIYRQNNISKFTQPTCFHQMLSTKQVEYFYKFIIDLFSRIQKINDNGRQILKSQQLQFSRLVGLQRTHNNGQNWQTYLQSYIQGSKERNESLVFQKIGRFILEFPIQWWKSNLVWIYYDASSKEKKDYLYKLVSAYYNRIISLPKI